MLRIIGLIICIAVLAWLLFERNTLTPARAHMQRPVNQQFRSLRSASIYLITICGLILGLTGLLPFLVFGAPMSGFVLLLHVAISPIFILAVVVATLIFSHGHQFDAADWKMAKICLTRKQVDVPLDGGYRLWNKIFFWLLVLGTTLLGAIVLSMYPLFGTVGMGFFLNLHKIAALLFLVAGAGYVYTYSQIKAGAVTSDAASEMVSH